MSTEAQQLRSRLGWLTRHRGPDHPLTVETARRLRVAKLRAAIRAAGLGQMTRAEFDSLVSDLRAARDAEKYGLPDMRPGKRRDPGAAVIVTPPLACEDADASA